MSGPGCLSDLPNLIYLLLCWVPALAPLIGLMPGIPANLPSPQPVHVLDNG